MKNKLKYILLVFTLSLLVGKLSAQIQYATTAEGKKVVLKPNGTWEYAESKASSMNQLRSIKNASSSHTTTASSSSRGSSARSIKSSSSPHTTTASSSSRSSSSRSYTRGPRGGCYYINSNGGKTYVDWSMCN